MNQPDHRRYRVQLDLGADSPEEIERVLNQIALDLYIDRERLTSGSGRVIDVSSGGYESGYSLKSDARHERSDRVERSLEPKRTH